jgi:large subunit ribosomal protein L25
MSSDTIRLTLDKREVVRKGLGPLRKSGSVPVVVHDHGKPSLHAVGQYVPVEKVVVQAGGHHPVELTVGSDKRLVLIRDIDHDPRTHKIRHVVFQAIRRDEKAQAEIPVEFSGDIPAERASLMVVRQLDTVEVEALPSDLPNAIMVDPSKLADVGDTMTVADLVAPSGVTILTDPTYPIATVEMPKDQVAEADAAAESLAEDAISSGAEDVPAEEQKSDEADEEASADESKEAAKEQ